MGVRSVLSISGSAVSRAAALGASLGEELRSKGINASILDARKFQLPVAGGSDEKCAALEDPASYDTAAFLSTIESARKSGDSEFLILLPGPLASSPEVSVFSDNRIFIDVEERLLLLRWADALMESGAPGGIEALQLYSFRVEPVYSQWSPQAIASSNLVLDDEEGFSLLLEKILWLLSSSIPAAATSVARAESAVVEARLLPPEKLAIIRAMEDRYTKPPSSVKGLAPAWRKFVAYRLYPALKRALDIILVSLLLMVIWPVFVLVAFLIWLDDPGPVFYSQTRIGQYGKTFPFPKFRSMVRNADKLKDKLMAMNEMAGGITFKMKRDPRILPIGFVIRKYSLDELPQLWSILRGDLSLVGPRPPVPREVALYTASDRRRLEVVPGLTCIWQVSGRSDIPFPRQVELDVEYLESRNLLLDLRLLIATVPAVITGKGAY